MAVENVQLSRNARLVLTCALAAYGMWLLARPTFGFLDSVDLAIHETGHLVFAPFGEFVGFLGGTLMQLLLPLAFLGYFIKEKDRHAASIVLWWVGQNMWNISVYVRDARAQLLPLVGGGEHDWAYILGRVGMLQQDQSIGKTVHLVGLLMFIASVVWGAYECLGRNPSETTATAS